jgi:hypothetical protein
MKMKKGWIGLLCLLMTAAPLFAELFLEDPHDFQAVFSRMVSAVNRAVDEIGK